MSSNIKIQRVCQHCGNEFTARTTTTQYCSDVCAKRAYKARKRAGKIEASNQHTQQVKTAPIEQLKAKEFLTVRDVAKLLNCSIRTAYRLIEHGNIKGVNIAQRKTLVKRSEIDKLFEEPQAVHHNQENRPEPVHYEISDCYTLTEVQTKYNISETALQQLIKRNEIPKLKKGWFAYVPKTVIDNLFTQPVKA